MLAKLLACLNALKDLIGGQTQKQCDLVDLADDALIKDCLLLDEFTNPNCPAPLASPLDKAAGTLTLEGDVASQYTAGGTISLTDANGNICGTATVAATGATYAEPNTTVNIEGCEMQEGKDPALVTSAKPVLAIAATAVKAIVKEVSLLSLKAATTDVKGEVAVKEEVTEATVRRARRRTT